MNLTEFEQRILSKLESCPKSMSHLQIESFIANGQLTTYKKIRQCYTEISVRREGLESSELELRKLAVKRKKLLRDIEQCSDSLDKELLEIDLIIHDKGEQKLRQVLEENDRELRTFVDLLGTYITSEEELDKYARFDAEEERRYWIARMGKQAALDLITFGRISVGNMDSITNMSQDDQLSVFSTALGYANGIQQDLQKIASIHPTISNDTGVVNLLDQVPERKDVNT